MLHESDGGFIDDLKTELGLSNADFEKVLSIIFNELGRGTITEDNFWNKLEKEFETRPVASDEKLLRRSLSKNFKPYYVFLNYLRDLKKRDLQTVVFSNTIESHVNILRNAGIYEGFDREFLSNETGYRKPDKEAFEYVLTELKLDPSEVIFVDDDPKNIEAAKELGIKGVLFKSETVAIQEIEKYLTNKSD